MRIRTMIVATLALSCSGPQQPEIGQLGSPVLIAEPLSDLVKIVDPAFALPGFLNTVEAEVRTVNQIPDSLPRCIWWRVPDPWEDSRVCRWSEIVVEINGEPARTVYLAPDTLAAVLTGGAAQLSVSLTIGFEKRALGPIRRYGFADSYLIAPTLFGRAVTVDNVDSATILASSNDGLAIVRLGSGRIVEVNDIQDHRGLFSVGRSYRENVYLLSSKLGRLDSWEIGSAGITHIDSLRGAGWDLRAAVEVAPGKFVLGDSQGIVQPDTLVGGRANYLRTATPLGAEFSPNRSLMVVLAHTAIYAFRGEGFAFQIEDAVGAFGAAFEPDGSIIYTMGGDGINRSRFLIAYDGSTGRKIKSIEFPEAGGFDVLRDPDLDLLYAGLLSDDSILIEVFRPITLEPIATFRAPLGDDFHGAFRIVLAMGRLERALYVVNTARARESGDESGPFTSVFRFDLPPVPSTDQ